MRAVATPTWVKVSYFVNTTYGSLVAPSPTIQNDAADRIAIAIEGAIYFLVIVIVFLCEPYGSGFA